jgi:hypothetical protein
VQKRFDTQAAEAMEAGAERCQRLGIAPEQLVQSGMLRHEIVDATCVDGLTDRDTAEGGKGARFEEWRRRNYPNHMAYRKSR